MSPTLETDSPFETMEDLLEQLGGIPPERVLLRPAPGTATEADVLAYEAAPRKRLCELIDGVLVEKAMGYPESLLAVTFVTYLNNFVMPRNLGLVSTADGMMRLFAGRVRIPDAAFVSWDHIPGRRRPKAPIPGLFPDLAIEILSRSNTRKEMKLKRRDYFRAGTRLVWQIDPKKRSVEVYTDPDTYTTLDESRTLTGDPVLPGFTLSLRDLFAEYDRQG
jgi:Uma2 family endonuclease